MDTGFQNTVSGNNQPDQNVKRFKFAKDIFFEPWHLNQDDCRCSNTVNS